MRRATLSIAGTLTVLACVTLLCAPSVFADEYAGFRIPDNGYRLWTMGLSGLASWNHATTGDVASSQGDARSNLSSTFTRQHETDTRFGGIGGSVLVSGDVNHSAQSRPTLLDDIHHVSWVEDASLLATQRWYLEHSRWFLGASGFGRVHDTQGLSRENYELVVPAGIVTRYRFWDSDRVRTYGTNLDLSVGIGWGRVRNATAIFETQVLEARLQAAGVLAHPLSDGARQRLAGLLYARNVAVPAYDRPAAPLWASLEQILRDDGALSDRGLAAEDVFRLTEPYLGPTGLLDATGLPSSPLARRVGWALSVNVRQSDVRQARHEDFATSRINETLGVPDPWSEDRGALFSRTTDDATRISLLAEEHRPLTARLQWDSDVDYEFSPRHDTKGYYFELETRIGWCVADRWLATASAGHTRQIDRDGADVVRSDDRSSTIGGTIQYFVTDHLAAQVEGFQTWSKRAEAGFSDQFRNGGSLSFGLTYRFSGDARIADVFPAAVAR